MNRGNPTDDTLRSLLKGQLEPDLAAEIREVVSARPSLRRRLQALRGELKAERSRVRASASAWWLPPPGLAGGWRAPTLGSGVATVLGERLRPGDRFIIPVKDLEEPERLQVVVLRGTGGSWEVVVPKRADEIVPASELRRGPDGAMWVELSAAEERGRQRWAVAFPPLDLKIDWSQDEEQRWADLREQLARAQVPSVGWEIEVGE